MTVRVLTNCQSLNMQELAIRPLTKDPGAHDLTRKNTPGKHLSPIPYIITHDCIHFQDDHPENIRNRKGSRALCRS